MFLKSEKNFGPHDPLFPATDVKLDGLNQSASTALSRRHWQTTAPIRDIFKTAFVRAGLHYHNPHSFRSTLARLGQGHCRTAEEMKAWSQNLGHTDMMTTFTSYGKLDDHRQIEVIAAIGKSTPASDIVGEFAEFVRCRQVSRMDIS